MLELIKQKRFEQIGVDRSEYADGYRAAQTALDLGKLAMQFARVERVPRYGDGERENDAEHSFMLALIAPELAVALNLPLDIGLVSQYSVGHDLIEVKTGDYATFLYTDNDQVLKEIREHQAIEQLCEELPPHTARIVRAYEAQADPASRYVRYTEKLLPIIVDIIGGGGKRVMEEDYGVTSVEALQQCHRELHDRLVKKFGGEFPALDLAHQLLCELFEAQYATSDL